MRKQRILVIDDDSCARSLNAKTLKDLKDLPVILMTANNHLDLLLEIRPLNLEGLLIKPVMPDKLAERVEKFFAKPAA